VNVDDVADAIKYWYDMPAMERKAAGSKGREWMLKNDGLNNQNMCNKMVDGIEKTLKNFTPKKRYNLYKLS
jgi:hypothetical protein